MSREIHVRFCERPEVKFLRPTHPYVAFVIDAYARRIVGWRVSRTAHASLRPALFAGRKCHPVNHPKPWWLQWIASLSGLRILDLAVLAWWHRYPSMARQT